MRSPPLGWAPPWLFFGCFFGCCPFTRRSCRVPCAACGANRVDISPGVPRWTLRARSLPPVEVVAQATLEVVARLVAHGVLSPHVDLRQLPHAREVPHNPLRLLPARRWVSGVLAHVQAALGQPERRPARFAKHLRHRLGVPGAESDVPVVVM